MWRCGDEKMCGLDAHLHIRTSAHLHFFLLCILASAFFSSCNVINPATPVPSYIRVNSIKLYTDYSTQGSNSNAITDAWVFVDEQVIGVFQMPVNVPILYSGSHTVTIQAGVIVDGIAATRINYPFLYFLHSDHGS